MKFLVLNFMIYLYSGSEINALQLCEELKRHGHEADIGALVIGSPMADEVARHGIKLIDLNKVSQPLNYDVIWAHHSPVLAYVLFKTNISDCKILYSSLSWLEPVEAPPTFHQDIQLFLSHSETSTSVMKENGVEGNKIVLFPNYAPKSFYLTIASDSRLLKRIAIVSNHVPKELSEFSDLANKNGIQVTIIGLQTQQKFVTRELLDEFDLVITIGKTVFYCFAMGKPVYVYDHFGGPGYVDESNIQNNQINNYSGRGGYPKKSAEELYVDIVENYEKNLGKLHFLQDLCRERYDLEKNLSNLLRKIDEIPVTVMETFRKNHSLDKRIYGILDYIKYTVSFELEDTKANLTERNQIIEKLSHELAEREQTIIEFTTKLAEREQMLSFANHEIVDYHNSTSWKITRPLRWLSKKIRGGIA